jgi:hypothetical protein
LSENAEHVLANMEQLGAETVRNMISSGRWPANYDALAKQWLHQKDTEERERKCAHGEAQNQEDIGERECKEEDREAQMLLARTSNEAHSAKEAALAANKRAEEANKRAEDANTIAREAKNIACAVELNARTAKRTKRIATAALVAGLIAIAISIISLLMRWPPILKALTFMIWQI